MLKHHYLKIFPKAMFFHVGDVYWDKKTGKTWRIVYLIQDVLGDYDLFIKDERGRIRAVKDYYLDEDVSIKKVKKLSAGLNRMRQMLMPF